MRIERLLFGLLLACSACSDSTTTDGTAPTPNPFSYHGAYLVKALIDCGGCHTADPKKPFAGGNKFPLDGAGHYVYSRNLTADPKTGLKLSEAEFIEALRTGADFSHQGESLLVMPWPSLRWLTTDDLRSLYYFLKLLPPTANDIPADDKGPFAAAGPVPMPTEYDEGEEVRPLPPESSQVPLGPPGETPTPDPGNAVRGAAILPLSYQKMPHFFARTAEEQAAFGRGSYLVNAGLCGVCHTNKSGASRSFAPGPTFLKIPTDAYLTGGAVFTVPAPLHPVLHQTRTMSANLIGKSGFFGEPDGSFLRFDAILQAMAHVDDTPPLPIGWPMPADHFRNLDIGSLTDIYTYMKILSEDYDHKGQADKATQAQARWCETPADCTRAHETCALDGNATPVVGNQCVGQACKSAADCDACQGCVRGACQAPSPGDPCLAAGL